MPQDIETLIVGAGPAGLAAASELAKHKKDFLIVEKDDCVGGLCKTYEFEENGLFFRADNGPHRFFSKNQYLYKFIEGLISEHWIEVKRQTRQFIAGKFYDYPIRATQALANIGPRKASRIVIDYLVAQTQYNLLKKPVINFEDYIIANFGRTLGNFNMINYTEKIWGVPASTIHTDWAKQRIKGLTVAALTKFAITGFVKNLKTSGVRTLTNTFYYPEYGTGLIYDTIAKQLKKQDYDILLNTQPVKIKHENNKITSVTCHCERNEMERGNLFRHFDRRSPMATEVEKSHQLDNIQSTEISRFAPLTRDDKVVYNIKNLIESIPIKDFLYLLDPLPPQEILAANQKIKYRDQVYLFLTLNKNHVTNDQWIYFPEKNIPFGRISEMKNFSQKMSPPGKTSLFIEFFCFKGDDIWNKTKEELTELTLYHLEKLGFCKKEEVRNSYLIKQEKVYPIYDTSYKTYIKTIKDYLNQFTNLHYIGRPGRFRYNNQDHSLEMGFLAAKDIITNQKHNLDLIGAEQKYCEQNKLQNG